ncbi:MAG: HAMP domain-containing protein [Gemmatimonadetes bacterium]|nr:HAMP domain-containing protein [Gemmatimonadota bacterium]
MRVATKLATGYGLLLAGLTAALLYQVGTVHRVVDANQTLSSLILRLSLRTSEQLTRLDEMVENGSKYWVTGDTGYAARFHQARRGFDRALADLRSLALSGEEEAELDSLALEWGQGFHPSLTLDDLIAVEVAARGDSTDFAAALDSAVDGLRRRTQNVYWASQRSMEDEVRESIRAAQQAQRISFAAVLGALALSLVVFGLVVRSITGALARLRRGTRVVAGGDFEYRLEAQRDDEFAELARDFNVMTARLQELDRAKRDFLSQVSHDLKAPLSAIQEANRLLLDGIPGSLNEKQRRLLEHNARSGRRLADMIGKLLDLSRIDAGALEYHFESCDLNEVIATAVSQFEHRGMGGEVGLKAELPDRPLILECDRERIRQVLENLLENAIRYSPDGGIVHVEARTFSEAAGDMSPDGKDGRGTGTSGFALIEVADSGPGVPDAEKNKIFERFYQAHTGKVGRDRGGVGLGLALCREIVRSHGGRIWVSDQPAGGSIFSVLLPADRSRAGPTERAAGTRPARAEAASAKVALTIVLAATLFSVACATARPFDRYLDAQLYVEAARAFDADSSLWKEPDALLRAGHLFANPTLPVYDATRARRTLERLVTEFPQSSQARQVGAMVPLLRVLEALELELAARAIELKERVQKATEMAASREAAALEIEALRQRVGRLEGDLRTTRQELERLKAIDLRPPRGGGS